MGVWKIRTTLGEQFNEGARLLWLALDERGWSQGDLRRKLTSKDDKMLRPGAISRWLFGDHRPSLPLAIQLRDLIGIPVEAWNEEPSQSFTPPGGVDDDDDETPKAANGDR